MVPRTLRQRLLATQSPMRRLHAHFASASTKQLALQPFVSAVVLVLILALTNMGGHPHRPITAVRGEVEFVDSVAELEGVATAPSVAIIDAVCITNTPTLEPC